MKKLFATLTLTAMLLAGCAAHQDPTLLQTEPPAPTAGQPSQPTQVIQQLTADKREEIENAWLTTTSQSLGNWYQPQADGTVADGSRYYGSYGGYDVVMGLASEDASLECNVGGTVFSHTAPFGLYGYRDGKFYDLGDLYEEGKITEEDLDMIARFHRQFQHNLTPHLTNNPLDANVELQMKSTFLKQYVKSGNWTIRDLSVVYYGHYENAHVGFINGILLYTQAFCSETVAGYTFHYSTGQKLLVFCDGKLMSMKEAFEQGFLSRESVAQIHESFGDNRYPNMRE